MRDMRFILLHHLNQYDDRIMLFQQAIDVTVTAW